MSSSNTQNKKRKNEAGKRSDPGWEHGTEVDTKLRKVKCKHCGKIYHGGIYRLKHHLAGTHSNVEPCLKVSEEVRSLFFTLLSTQFEETQKKKRVLYDIDDDIDVEVESSNDKGKKVLGSMDKFINKSARQTTINEKFKKEERIEVCQQIGGFFYTSAIAFNCATNPEFKLMLKKVGDFGKGLVPPSYHEIRETYLKKEVEATMNLLVEFQEQWKKTGCTLMSDGWSDRKHRSICNFLVNSPSGTIFLSSLDTSDISKTGTKVFEMLDDIVEKVGEENIVQLVTDNAPNYKVAGRLGSF